MSQNILRQYFDWHYGAQTRALIGVWKNLLRFNLYYFSFTLLLKTFFYPWHRYQWSYGRGFEFGKYLQVFFSNLISKIFGALIRSFLILVGILTEIFIVLAGAVVLILWLLLPALLIVCLWLGFRVLF